ncbi:hypothetical protein GYMLUDRAFT_488226 [Collybiopsis luxurians FD-317 M1]|uniref:Uncharacterized protein n=1 Tax=Collybiopsis luxurians FD-317 M1 TaxID=944289 RepID=A0A0D0BFM0_9AGAR|nr:hypothetical protein GYMLUDRAFT_488226 [Collybiopsis luxurians FD-317 M1]
MVFLEITISSLFILRVTALYRGSKKIRVFLGGLAVSMVCNAVVQIVLSDPEPPLAIESLLVADLIGNVPIISNSQGHHQAYICIGLFIFDVTVFSLTAWKTIYMFKGKHIQRGIGAVIIRDGLIYFGIITAVTLTNAFILAFGPEVLKQMLNILITMLSSILMSHMMFNLREDKYSVEYSTLSLVSGVLFAHPYGGNGAALEVQNLPPLQSQHSQSGII